jgi:FdhD protein
VTLSLVTPSAEQNVPCRNGRRIPVMPTGRTEEVIALRFGPRESSCRSQEVVVEAPLEIRLGESSVCTTMRTPGNDFELSVGRLLADGYLLDSSSELRRVEIGSHSGTHPDVLTVLPVGRPEPLAARPGPLGEGAWSPAALARLGDSLVERQELFSRTGGAHGAAGFDPGGTLVVLREDVGRHNAVDKVVGHLLLDGLLPVTGWALWTSGRVSFEMVRKALAAGFGALVSVSAPSSLAVSAAEQAGMILAGFARDGECTVYTGELR